MSRYSTMALLALASLAPAPAQPLQVAGRTYVGGGQELKPLVVSDAKYREILNQLLQASARYEAHQKYQDYSDSVDLGSKLDQATTAARAKLLIDALKPLDNDSMAKVFILGALGRVGDPAEIAPIFLTVLQSQKTPGYETYISTSYVARQYVMHCPDPRAVDYLIGQLTSPHPDNVVKEEAYTHVAGAGGVKGAQVVLAMRRQRALLSPLSVRVLGGYVNAGEFGGRTKLVAEKKDASGRDWGLFDSGALGNVTDVWLAEKTGGKWTHPLFTGVFTSRVSPWAKNTPAPTIGGLTGSQLLKANWVKLVVGNPKLSKSSDQSGLTDLEKLRLGLHIGKADSDGDGDPDSTDPWPNAPKRPLDDAGQVLAAAFEARFHFDDNVGPMILRAPAGMKPFEMPGRLGPTLWESEADKDRFHALDACYEEGVGYIDFTPHDNDKSKPWQDQLIQWSSDHSQAAVDIGLVYGGLNGTGYHLTLRKFLGQWVVTDMTQTWVS